MKTLNSISTHLPVFARISRRQLFSGVAGWGVASGAAAIAAPAHASQVPFNLADSVASRFIGSPDATVTIIEYFSFTCPACRRFHTEILPVLEKNYISKGELRIELRDFPLDRFATRAALLSRCAPKEQYHEFVKAYFEAQPQWIRATNPAEQIDIIAALGGMPQDLIDRCLASKELFESLVDKVGQGQKQYNLTATPTFILPNNETIVGVPDLEELEAKIQQFIAAKRT